MSEIEFKPMLGSMGEKVHARGRQICEEFSRLNTDWNPRNVLSEGFAHTAAGLHLLGVGFSLSENLRFDFSRELQADIFKRIGQMMDQGTAEIAPPGFGDGI